MKSTQTKAPATAEQFDALEHKERRYLLKGNAKPLTFTLNCRHAKGNPLLYYDPIKKQQRALRYCNNQPSPFVDEQDKNESVLVLEHVVFEEGLLVVPAENRVLQKLLFIHPKNGQIFYEFDKTAEAQNEVKRMDLEDKARDVARNMDVQTAEAILRINTTSDVDNMTAAEVKRDIRLYARQHPEAFLDAINDPQMAISNTIAKLLDQGIITVKNGRDVHYNLDTNKKKMFTIPLNDDPEAAIKQFFLTDEGLEMFPSLEARLV